MMMENIPQTEKCEHTERLYSLLEIGSDLSDGFGDALNEKARQLLVGALAPHTKGFFDEDLETTSKHSIEEDVDTSIRGGYEYTERLRRVLLNIDNNISDAEFHTALNERSKELLHELTPDAKDFFSNDLDAIKHSQKDVRKFIRCIPSVLSRDDGSGEVLLHRLMKRDEAVQFIPAVADEAIQMDYYKDPSVRGGLLCDAWGSGTILDLLYIEYNMVYPFVVIALREMGLLKKEDIRERAILFHCNPNSFEFFADWDPSELKTKSPEYGAYVHHYMIEYYRATSQFMPAPLIEPLLHRTNEIIKASFRHYPGELGLLTLRNDRGNTVWDRLNVAMGSQEAWEMIVQSIDESCNDELLEESSEGAKVPFSPLFTAAVSDLTDDLNILYHLLRKEPAQWIAYVENNDSERPRNDAT